MAVSLGIGRLGSDFMMHRRLQQYLEAVDRRRVVRIQALESFGLCTQTLKQDQHDLSDVSKEKPAMFVSTKVWEHL
jgi:hypothetical protein